MTVKRHQLRRRAEQKQSLVQDLEQHPGWHTSSTVAERLGVTASQIAPQLGSLAREGVIQMREEHGIRCYASQQTPEPSEDFIEEHYPDVEPDSTSRERYDQLVLEIADLHERMRQLSEEAEILWGSER